MQQKKRSAFVRNDSSCTFILYSLEADSVPITKMQPEKRIRFQGLY